VREQVAELGDVRTARRAVEQPIIKQVQPRRGPDRFDLAILAAFAAVSVWVLGLDLWQVIAHGRVWTGTDGFFLTDQMQYVSWIRDASHHVLASNLYVLRPTPADYFQPVVAIAGALTALGVAPWLALLLWKPIAVVGAFFAVRAFVRRSLPGRWDRRAALALGLFFGSFAVIGDIWTPFWSWGYPFGLLSLAATVGALLAYQRGRGASRIAWGAPLLGAIASFAHPWQGETLIAIVIGAELVLNLGRPRRVRLAAVTVIATSLPLIYYAVLARADLSWGLARGASKHSFAITHILLALGPLLLPALLAYRGRPRTFLAAATRTWPVAALVVYLFSSSGLSGTPLHAFGGISIPLAVLAIEGVKRIKLRRTVLRRLARSRLLRPRVLGTLVVAALTIPATAYQLATAEQFMAPTPGNANFITPDESRALDYLANNPKAGGVFTRFYLGAVLPARTGRHTFVGACLWSQPDCTSRAQIAQMVFDGSVPATTAQMFVRASGAAFVLSDCQIPDQVASALGSMIVSVHRFGCAAVYGLDAPTPPRGPLAEFVVHAAVRAPRR
jgi:hypothetical protein